MYSSVPSNFQPLSIPATMTFAKSDALISRFGRPRRSRVALALSHAIFDSRYADVVSNNCSASNNTTCRIRPQVVPFGSSKLAGRAAQDYFEILLEQEGCLEAWTEYTDVTTATAFPQKLAQGAAPLNGFRHYTLVR